MCCAVFRQKCSHFWRIKVYRVLVYLTHASVDPDFGVHGDHKQIGGRQADGARHEPKAEGGGAHVAEVKHARDSARELQLGRVVEGVREEVEAGGRGVEEGAPPPG